MTYKTYIGIDNGVSGAWGVIAPLFNLFIPTPIFLTQDYTKTKKNINRIDVEKLITFLESFDVRNSIAILERPMVNPGRFQSTASALRCLEATLIILERFKIPYRFIDSKEWQKVLLPKELKKEELKKASMDIGIRLFPNFKDQILKQKDADALLIAEYSRRSNF